MELPFRCSPSITGKKVQQDYKFYNTPYHMENKDRQLATFQYESINNWKVVRWEFQGWVSIANVNMKILTTLNYSSLYHFMDLI